MRKVSPKGVLPSLLKWLVLPLLLFVILVALFDNKNILTLSIKTASGQPAEPVIYYTKKGIAFNEDHRCQGWKGEGTLYYFSLPSFNQIDFARLDPLQHGDKVHIDKRAFITTTRWFKTYYYEIDMTKSEPSKEIKDYQVTPQGISFLAGRNIFLNLNLTRKYLGASHDYHLDTLIIALFAYWLLTYLYARSKKEPLDTSLRAKMILYLLFIAFSLFKAEYYKSHIHYTYPPDTIAHISYIGSVHKEATLFPKFEEMYMITNPNAGNYLSHPPLYYMLMNSVYDPKIPFMDNIERFRALNIALFFASLVLLVYLGLAAKMDILGDFVYLSVLLSIPMHAYIGSSLNNDNLALLGGLLFLVGLFRLVRQQYGTLSYVILGMGFFLAYFGKLTAAMMAFFALIYYGIYLYKKRIPLHIPKGAILILAVWIAPVMLYQLYIFMHYHAIVPTLKVTHPQEYLHSVYFIPEAKRVPMSFTAWLGHYWENIRAGWFGILSHHSFTKTSFAVIFGAIVLHIFAILGLIMPCRQESRTICILGKVSLLALFSVMLIQILFSYINFLHSGYMGGLQPRYLLPFMVAFAIMASVFITRVKENFWIVTITILLCIEAIYSDFFYFLTYYV